MRSWVAEYEGGGSRDGHLGLREEKVGDIDLGLRVEAGDGLLGLKEERLQAKILSNKNVSGFLGF